MNDIVLKEEQSKLNSVLEYIRKEKIRLEEEEKKQAAEVKKQKLAAGGSFTMDLFVAEKIYAISERLLKNIFKSLSTPYFTRIDFRNDEEKSERKYYIGKWGVSNTKTQEPIVIDWRSPIANLYYTHQVGSAEYSTPEGEVTGEILLKRLFNIEEGQIKNIIEADIISEGDYLNDVLSDHADARLKDIVTTIQSEQNAVLRYNHRAPIIVQGVAGAGKTTIALHRIMWMLYTFQKTMEPKNIMVIAPSPLFLDYISAVLPDMGVEDVIQETFYGLACRLCSAKLYNVDDSYILLNLLDKNVSDLDKTKYINYAKFKGSLVFKEILNEYIANLYKYILPKEGLYIKTKQVISYDKIISMFINELSPFNFSDRKKELKKSLSNIYNTKTKIEQNSVESKVKKRANLVREVYKDDAEKRQSLMKELYKARDEKIAEIDEFSKNTVKNYIDKLKVPTLLDSYKHFLSEYIPSEKFIDYTDEWNILKEITLKNLQSKKMETSDIPPLLILQEKLFGHKETLDIHHTVLDEAQDFSPFMFDTLKSLTHNNSFTIVGDLAQGIYAYQGVQNWGKMKNDVFDETSSYFELVTSYRNTVEIMNLAEKCAIRHSQGRTPAKPVLRHGEMPKLIKANNLIDDIAAEIQKHLDGNMKSIAVIDKMPNDCIDIYKKLKKKIPDIKYLDDKNTVYEGGIMVMPAYLCKGLEFDCVIIANAEESNFPDDFLHSRLLYVCMTRPIHKLSLYYTDSASKLVDENLCEQVNSI
ncbi:MAG: RNA polymerase recycling motor HelD [Eubacteriales bacterium]